MLKIAIAAAAIFTAYKIGENKARLEQLDFFLTKSIVIPGHAEIQYLLVDPEGNIQYNADVNKATIFNYWDAMSMRAFLKKFAPDNNVKLETVSSLILAE